MKARGTGRIYARRYGPAPKPGETDRRHVSWWVEYWHHGVQHRESVDKALRKRASTAKDAADLLKKRLGEIGQGRQVLGRDAEKLDAPGPARHGDRRLRAPGAGDTPPLERLLEFFGGEERALDITPDRARAFHRYRHQQGAKAATIRNEVATLGRGLTLAFEAGKLPQRPAPPDASRQ